MSKKDQTATCPMDSAVRLTGVTKTFVQWQKDPTAKGLLKNLLKPEKRVITALDNVSMEVRQGEFLAYAGPNGAGKSTTMKLLSGMLLPNSGEISVLSLSPQKNRQALMSRIGVLFGNRSELWWDHPVIQSYEWKKVVWNIPEEVYRRRLAMVTELLHLKNILTTFARELSLGQRMRADLGMLLLHEPELILLDEPTLGLDVVAKRQMIEFLKTINREDQVTLMVTSHDMDDLEEMARRIVMISNGALVYDGSFDGLRDTAGSPTHVTLTMEGERSAPTLDGGTLIAAENGLFTFEVDLAKHSTKHLLYQLSQTEGVRDVEIGKAPIEQVIAELYSAWRKKGR